MPYVPSNVPEAPAYSPTAAYAYKEPRAAPPTPPPAAPRPAVPDPRRPSAANAPVPVVVLCVLLGASAVLALVGGLSMLSTGPFDGDDEGLRFEEGFVGVLGLWLVVAALAQAAAAWGILAGARWGWLVAFGTAAIGVFVSLLAVFRGVTLIGVVGLLFAAVVLASCFHAQVLAWCGTRLGGFRSARGAL